MSANLKYELEEHLGTISQNDKITVELNLVKWSGSEPKFDLRRWKNEENVRMPHKGITMTAKELAALKKILDGLEV